MKKIKNLYLALFGAAVLALANISCSSSSSLHTQINFPEFETQVLENGVTLYFIKDNSLPFVSVQALVEAGSTLDPAGKEGSSFLTFEMLKEGSKNNPGQKLKEAYSNLGTSLQIDIDRESVGLRTKALSKYSDQITDLFIETLTQPQFSNSAFAKVKSKHLADLERNREKPSAFIDWLFYKELFGPEHPYGSPTPGVSSGVKSISLSDIQSFYSNYFDPSRLQVAVTGLFTDSTKQILVEKLGALKLNASVKLEAKVFTEVKPSPTRILFVDKPGMAQAEIRMGYQGIKRNDPDYIPLYVANSAIGGGGFSSRLMQEVRVKRGLVYGIRSTFLGLKERGPFMVAASTRHDKIPELIKVVLQEIESGRLDGVTEKELSDQKSTLLGQFPRGIETNEYYIAQVMKFKVLGFGDDYMKSYLRQVAYTTVKQSKELLNKHYRNTELVITVLGSKKELTQEFEQMGFPVEYKTYTQTGF